MLDEMNDALENCKARLLAELTERGCWEGRLSSSALATAVASFALHQGGRIEAAERGREWIRNNRNADGGWGDSPESPSNLTTTLLCRCVLDEDVGDPSAVRAAILRFYGSDRTFSIPILTLCMLAGKLGDDWSIIPQLPFELAVFPHRFYRSLRLPVVSYALPALIAMGLARHANRPQRAAFWRNGMKSRVLDILQCIQPESGGFLEAAPLTGFVAMSLIGAGFREHPVTRSCLRFLEETVREDGSWPIDVNLSTWLTSLSVRALGGNLPEIQRDRVREYLLATQLKEEHPFTHAAPGGWAWTDRSGGVPDADDTAAALIALHHLMPPDAASRTVSAARAGVKWLMDLQNRDGGIPTFCKGWGKLPFDRSCPDLTAHMIRAFTCWSGRLGDDFDAAMINAIELGLDYLARTQQSDGSWIPLWFGNQAHPKQHNPVYGTVRVIEALEKLDERKFPKAVRLCARGVSWLENISPDEALYGVEEIAMRVGITGNEVGHLLDLTRNGTLFSAGPIGLYFASLWYSERLYPLIFTTEALTRCLERRGTVPGQGFGQATNQWSVA